MDVVLIVFLAAVLTAALLVWTIRNIADLFKLGAERKWYESGCESRRVQEELWRAQESFYNETARYQKMDNDRMEKEDEH